MPSRLFVRQHRDDHATGVQHRVLLSRGGWLMYELPVRDMELLDGGIILRYLPCGLRVHFERRAAMPAGVLLAGRPDRVPAVSHWDVRKCPGLVFVHRLPSGGTSARRARTTRRHARREHTRRAASRRVFIVRRDRLTASKRRLAAVHAQRDGSMYAPLGSFYHEADFFFFFFFRIIPGMQIARRKDGFFFPSLAKSANVSPYIDARTRRRTLTLGARVRSAPRRQAPGPSPRHALSRAAAYAVCYPNSLPRYDV